MTLEAETRFRLRLIPIVLGMAVLAQPYAMMWQALDGNGTMRWVFNRVGWSWLFTVSICGSVIVSTAILAGVWKFRVALRDVSLDKS